MIYGPPSIVEPEPALDHTLYPGGSAEGWLIVQSTIAEKGLMLVFEPSSGSDDRWYLSLVTTGR